MQFLADMEANPLLMDSVECQRLVMEAMKYHLLPERRPLLQSPRTRPRKATVGALFAVGGMDATKGIPFISFFVVSKVLYSLAFVFKSMWVDNKVAPHFSLVHSLCLSLSISARDITIFTG